jgi:hypothetical protein
MERRQRVRVLVPYLTHIEPDCERGLRELETAGYRVHRFAATAAIDRSRSDLATQALADGAEWLMWIDSDISFELASVDQLLAHDRPFVAGIYAKKGVRGMAVYLEDGTRELVVGTEGKLYDVRYVGAGFTLVHRKVYDDVQRHFSLPICNTRFGLPSVPYYLPMVIAEPGGTYWYLGEDYAFCERARQAGHMVTVDTTIRLGHVGKYVYGWEDAGMAVPRVTTGTFRIKPDGNLERDPP